MSDWIALIAGLAILALVFSDRQEVKAAWREPARWWRPSEYWRSRSPSQPLNLLLGMVLGGAAVIYGLVSLLA